MSAPLIELLTEELPPKALQNCPGFAQGVHEGLVKHGLAAKDSTVHPYTTPLAVLVEVRTSRPMMCKTR